VRYIDHRSTVTET